MLGAVLGTNMKFIQASRSQDKKGKRIDSIVINKKTLFLYINHNLPNRLSIMYCMKANLGCQSCLRVSLVIQ